MFQKKTHANSCHGKYVFNVDVDSIRVDSPQTKMDESVIHRQFILVITKVFVKL